MKEDKTGTETYIINGFKPFSQFATEYFPCPSQCVQKKDAFFYPLNEGSKPVRKRLRLIHSEASFQTNGTSVFYLTPPIQFSTTQTSGSGIGLSLCKQIITLHDGSINIKSESGKESYFILTFPK